MTSLFRGDDDRFDSRSQAKGSVFAGQEFFLPALTATPFIIIAARVKRVCKGLQALSFGTTVHRGDISFLWNDRETLEDFVQFPQFVFKRNGMTLRLSSAERFEDGVRQPANINADEDRDVAAIRILLNLALAVDTSTDDVVGFSVSS